jgi:hypothetical protein
MRWFGRPAVKISIRIRSYLEHLKLDLGLRISLRRLPTRNHSQSCTMRAAYLTQSLDFVKGLLYFLFVFLCISSLMQGHVTRDRSMDSPSPDLVQILARSMVPVVSVLALGTTVGSTTVGRSVTLGLRFVDSMKELMSKLNGTCAHYIRCIKPNSLKAREVFSGGLVFEQLRYSGILEALAIRRSGLPFRFKFSDFVRRYRCVFLIERSLSCREMSTRPPLSSMIPSNQCREVLSATGQSFAALRLVCAARPFSSRTCLLMTCLFRCV